MLIRLRDRAFSRFATQDVDRVANYSAKPRIDTSDFDDELEMFGGHTKLLVTKLFSQQQTPQKAPVGPPPPSPPPIDNQQSLMDFFATQMGPSWATPGPDDTLPIPQPQPDYGNDISGLPVNPSFFTTGEWLNYDNTNVSGSSPMFENAGGISEDYLMQIFEDYTTDTGDFQVQDTLQLHSTLKR
jgi:hypothetical protein